MLQDSISADLVVAGCAHHSDVYYAATGMQNPYAQQEHEDHAGPLLQNGHLNDICISIWVVGMERLYCQNHEAKSHTLHTVRTNVCNPTLEHAR